MTRVILAALLAGLVAYSPAADAKGKKRKQCKGKLSEREVTGVYVATNCGDYCYATLNIDGKEEGFLVDTVEVPESDVGKKFKLKVSKEDEFVEEAGSCMTREIILSVTPVK